MEKKRKINYNNFLIFVGACLILYVLISSLIVNNYSIIETLYEFLGYFYLIILLENKSIILFLGILCIIFGIYKKTKLSEKNSVLKYKILKFIGMVPFFVYVCFILLGGFTDFSGFGNKHTSFIEKIFTYAFVDGIFLSPFLILGIIINIACNKKLKNRKEVIK